MPSEMRCVSWLILMILTLTVWPMFTTSDGWLTRRQAMSVTCEQAVDAAEIDEGAVLGDVLDDAVDDLTLFEVGHELGALLGAALLEHGAARHDDVAAAAIHLEDLEGLRRRPSAGVTSRTGRMSTWERGRNATAPSRSTV